jgi:spermidine synthase
VILLACLLLPPTQQSALSSKARRLDLAFPVLIFLLTFGLGWLADKVAPAKVGGLLFVLAVPLFLSYPLRKRPLRFALSLGAVMVGAGFVTGAHTNTLHSERNFFGVLRVIADQTGGMHSFLHGSTVHGRQNMEASQRCEPLSYYHRQGPLGRIFAQAGTMSANPRIAIIGLGAGATASYARTNEKWTFYEINPAVVSIARSNQYFSYLDECAKAPFEVVLGDARLKLRGAPDAGYDLIVLDAFSSDSIPLHLVTQQALDLYLSKLAPSGMLVFHISNRNLDLTPVLAALAQSRSLTALSMLDLEPSQPNGKDPSHWVALARDGKQLGALLNDPKAKLLSANDTRQAWTDDFSNIISVFKWQSKAE